MKDLMLDLETLSTSPRAAIVQIGACFFDRHTGEIGSTFKTTCAPDIEKYAVDYSTIAWWMRQSDDARLSSFGDGAPNIGQAISSFYQFVILQRAIVDFRIWAMPAAFDVVIIENALRTELFGVPWKYNESRDVRTIMEVAEISKDERVLPDVAHDALSDAIAQAKTVAKAFQKIRGDRK